MKAVLPLYLMVDACGWEIVRQDPFCAHLAPHRRRLESVFGYSSTCVPSVVSGCWPVEHRNWCYFVYDPVNSPFRTLRWFRWLPKALTSRRRVRQLLTRLAKRRLQFEGYFDLYNIPFEHIHLFDFTEKKSPLRPKGMNRGSNIFDFLQERHIAYSVSDPEAGEQENLDRLIEQIDREAIDFAFVYWPKLDGLLHQVGNQSEKIQVKLREYEQWIERLVDAASRHYRELRLYVFSDHGMANCDHHLDLKSKIEALPVEFGTDYVAVYDSTMARFWFLQPHARTLIIDALSSVDAGRVLSDEELKEMNTLFPDRYFGELIFLANEGVLIVPSHMGERPIRAMHGYHPKAPHSYAALLTNRSELPASIQALPDLFQLMSSDAEEAKRRNASSNFVPSSSHDPRSAPVLGRSNARTPTGAEPPDPVRQGNLLRPGTGALRSWSLKLEASHQPQHVQATS